MIEVGIKHLEQIRKFCVDNNVQLIDGVIHWCEKNNIEIEYVAGLIKKDNLFKKKMLSEAKNLNFVKKQRVRSKRKKNRKPTK
jgi:hypothetical protein